MPKKTKDISKNNKLTKETTTKKPKSSTTTKKSNKQVNSSKSTNAKVTTKKSAPAKKKNTKKATNVKKVVKSDVLEYYDLPYRYNQTIIKILAQTPTTLFVYWDISDADRSKYIAQYGNEFFNTTVPVLIVHNRTKNYSFEIEVNDFANSWYFNVSDANCHYEVELGRRPKQNNNIEIPNNYVYVASSNNIEAPNDHILFEKEQKIVFFKNTKNNQTHSKNIANLDFMHKIGKIYNIYEVYKKIYKDEEFENIQNPTSY